MKALLTNYRQSPRKVRLVADMIRGVSVVQAQQKLTFTPQKAANAVAKLLASAVANAQQSGVSIENLVVKSITVDKGTVMKRMRPFARGRAGRIAKIASIIRIELSELKAPAAKKRAPAKKAVKAAVKTAA